MFGRNFWTAAAKLPLWIACLAALFTAANSAVAQVDSTQIEALSRLKDIDLEANPALKAAVVKILEKTKGTAQFVEIVRDFKLEGYDKELYDFALAHPNDSTGVEAFKLSKDVWQSAGAPSVPLVQLMGNAGEKKFIPFLQTTVTNRAVGDDIRKAAVKAMAATEEGAAHILKLASEDKLDSSLRFTATTALHSAPWLNIKTEAAKILPLPQTQNAALPPVAELVKIKGNPANGAKVFRRPEVNCIGCHQINGEGVDFGPKLSEIGTKLAKQAIYESILDPSSGIAFGFEQWQIELKDGDEATGIITSESPDEIVVKAQTGISTHYKKSDIAKRTKSALSIMPLGLQQTMSQQDLVDLVEYLSGLKKK